MSQRSLGEGWKLQELGIYSEAIKHKGVKMLSGWCEHFSILPEVKTEY